MEVGELLELLVLLKLESCESDIAELGILDLQEDEGGPKFSFFRCEQMEVQIFIGKEFVIGLQYIWFQMG